MPSFGSFQEVGLKKPEGFGGTLDSKTINRVLSNMSSMQIGGIGARAFRVDDSGIWLGAAAFADAPFSVDMNGNLIASSATFSAYLSKTGTGQSFTGDFDVGNGNVSIDGANKRILINDGTDDRVLIGFQSGGF